MGLWGAYYKKGMNDEALAEARRFFSVLHDRESCGKHERGTQKNELVGFSHDFAPAGAAFWSGLP